MLVRLGRDGLDALPGGGDLPGPGPGGGARHRLQVAGSLAPKTLRYRILHAAARLSAIMKLSSEGGAAIT